MGVKKKGCSGLAYTMDFVDKKEPLDEIVEQDGVKVLIESKALFSLIGTEMDFIENPLESQFVFKNPNVKGTCGCGLSFTT